MSKDPYRHGIIVLDFINSEKQNFLLEMCSYFFYMPLDVVFLAGDDLDEDEEEESETITEVEIDETYYYEKDVFFSLMDRLEELKGTLEEGDSYEVILPMDLTSKQREMFYRHMPFPFWEYSAIVINYLAANAKGEMSEVLVERMFSEISKREAHTYAESTRMANIAIKREKNYLKNSEEYLVPIIESRKNKILKYYNSDIPIIALIGYPSAGKSTLFNNLLSSLTGVKAKREPFTIEPKYKHIKNFRYPDFYLMNGTGLIISEADFIFSNLAPYYEEYGYADLVVNIVDTTNADYLSIITNSENFLKERQVNPHQKVVHLLSKSDLENSVIRKIPRSNELLISLANSDDTDDILAFIFSELYSEWPLLHLFLPYEVSKEKLFKHAYVTTLEEKENGYEVTAYLNPKYLNLYNDYIV
ncbi:MAG: 50S ribosome-binding GTPase [Coprobacillus sp.]|nr:50S ribosome-binding GTPase [Coprobacillus sp.]